MIKYLKEKKKTGIGFTGDRVMGFYKKCGLKTKSKLCNRFFYDYGNPKTNKQESKWGGFYYEGKDKFISKLLKTKSKVNIPCEHW